MAMVANKDKTAIIPVGAMKKKREFLVPGSFFLPTTTRGVEECREWTKKERVMAAGGEGKKCRKDTCTHTY